MMSTDAVDEQQDPTPLPWESIRPEDDVVATIGSDPSTPVKTAPASMSIDQQDEPAEAEESAPSPEPTFVTAHVDTAAIHAVDLVDDADEPMGPPVRGGGWTLPLLCAGLCLLACCIVIPQADLNRRANYEKRELQMDLAAIQKQVFVNDQFLKKVGEDPTLAERLAQRQMKIVRQGTHLLKLDGESANTSDMSPFQLTHVERPEPLPPYQPIGGALADLCYGQRPRLYLTGLGLLMVAGGLILGFSPRNLA